MFEFFRNDGGCEFFRNDGGVRQVYIGMDGLMKKVKVGMERMEVRFWEEGRK